MRYILGTLTVAVMLAGFCTGCDKSKNETPEAVADKAKAAAAKDWTPETAAPAHDPNDGGDHTGHNH
jgi:hypothetical protein